MPNTARAAITYPEGVDNPNIPAVLQELAQDVDAKISIYLSGTTANRPAASNVGRFYYSTNEQVVYFDTGSVWIALSPQDIFQTTEWPPTTPVQDKMYALLGSTSWYLNNAVLIGEIPFAWRSDYKPDLSASHPYRIIGATIETDFKVPHLPYLRTAVGNFEHIGWLAPRNCVVEVDWSIRVDWGGPDNNYFRAGLSINGTIAGLGWTATETLSGAVTNTTHSRVAEQITLTAGQRLGLFADHAVGNSSQYVKNPTLTIRVLRFA